MGGSPPVGHMDWFWDIVVSCGVAVVIAAAGLIVP
jgi:hypothetical protein